MLTRLSRTFHLYPFQFWMIFLGLLISTIGSSMIWPFLMVYVSEKLDLPLSSVTILITLNSVMGLIFSLLAGPVIDKVGRKWIMAISLLVNGLAYIIQSQANSLPVFAIAMALSGAFNPLYRVGADAMMADLIPGERRADAYSLLRTSNNLGVAMGPAIGGMLVASSYSIAFYIAATGMILYSLLVTFRFRETLPSHTARRSLGATQKLSTRQLFGGYNKVFGDRTYMTFIFFTILVMIPASMLWVLLSVYVKQNYAIPENKYGFLPTTNALMVVFLQVAVTQITKRYRSLPVLAVGSLCYAIGVGSIAWMTGFWGFWISMVVMTIGELIQSPTASTFAANRAPADMRGRYMSLYGLTWPLGSGIGPLLGGFLNDSIRPQAIWIGALVIGLLSSSGFTLMALAERRRKPDTEPEVLAEQP
ncbi:MAG TPA: MFS transporter [Anaerolineales bacterium]|nr:MFS transporter [Anaerolineales bacterium]